MNPESTPNPDWRTPDEGEVVGAVAELVNGVWIHKQMVFRDGEVVLSSANDEIERLRDIIRKLRAALVGFVGVDTKEELEQMKRLLDELPIPATERNKLVAGIDVLLETL